MQNTFYSSLKHITLQIVIAYRFCVFVFPRLLPRRDHFSMPVQSNQHRTVLLLFRFGLAFAADRNQQRRKRKRDDNNKINHRNFFFSCRVHSLVRKILRSAPQIGVLYIVYWSELSTWKIALAIKMSNLEFEHIGGAQKTCNGPKIMAAIVYQAIIRINIQNNHARNEKKNWRPEKNGEREGRGEGV